MKFLIRPKFAQIQAHRKFAEPEFRLTEIFQSKSVYFFILIDILKNDAGNAISGHLGG